ncbi:Protein phosphatase 2C 7, mitochondrial [Hanseniaspora osmophila]|uniref:Protein phosphatase n=1 Tax=Hanseniaspora osmophila TaxID=56408 RepID=A0A1E5R2B4_9ASCO|nr:Protein phosphatase 2C 7, mitochondrial [Hanseniaspora osmophila]
MFKIGLTARNTVTKSKFPLLSLLASLFTLILAMILYLYANNFHFPTNPSLLTTIANTNSNIFFKACAFNSYYSNYFWKLSNTSSAAPYLNNASAKRSFFTSSAWSSSSSSGGSGSGSGSGAYSSGGNASGQLFNYKIAVAYQAKDRSDPIYSKWNLPPLPPTGEDNYFIGLPNLNEAYCGVADGVGGWIEMGFDSSAISQELCLAMKSISESSAKELEPKQLLSMAYEKIQKDKIVQAGSTTAVVAHLSEGGKLTVTNLGDSWCGVFRGNKLVFKTQFQTLGFNTPYQLSIIPEKIMADAKKRGSSYITNTPNDADNYEFQLKSNDVIVLATDGVTDNIDVGDMELFLQNNEKSNKDLTVLAQEFVAEVVKLSKDPYFPSVFSQELAKVTGKNYTGGKEDDITCIVVKVE